MSIDTTDFQPLSGREFPRFSGIKTFFRLPVVDYNKEFDVAVMGVPFDGALSYRPGARFAPSKVREASSLGRGFHWSHENNVFSRLKVADIGDCSIVPIDRDKTYALIEEHYDKVLATGKKVIGIGGDHSITLPILRSFKKKYGKPLTLVHFDAHLDTYPSAWGIEYHHGSFLRHAVEEGLVDPKKTYQFGIRGPFAGANDLDYVNEKGIHVFNMDHIRKQGLESFLQNLPQFDKDEPVYLSFDIDCLDPSYAPATGTPVVGGLTTYETQRIIRELNIPNLVGADIVEVSPPYDHADITALAAVDTLFELLHKM